jgi:hypothetical protein
LASLSVVYVLLQELICIMRFKMVLTDRSKSGQLRVDIKWTKFSLTLNDVPVFLIAGIFVSVWFLMLVIK